MWLWADGAGQQLSKHEQDFLFAGYSSGLAWEPRGDSEKGWWLDTSLLLRPLPEGASAPLT